jgi:chitodextrinase
MRIARLIAVLTFLVVPATAHAASLFVATTGDDANIGTVSAPFRTIAKAAKMARPGDSVQVRAGVYYEAALIVSKGTADARILFQPYNNEKVVLDGGRLAPLTSIVQLYESEYVDFQGFEVRNSTRVGIYGYGADNVRVMNNVVHTNYRGGIHFSAPEGALTTNITISGNRVYNNCLENIAHTATSGWGQAVGVFRAQNVTIVGNEVFKNHGEGIDFVLTDVGYAADNKVSDNYGVNLYFDNAQDVTAERNLLFTTYDSTFYRHSAPATGIAVANEFYEYANISSNLKITSNLVIGGRVGFYHGNYDRNAGLANVTVANNTFYGASWTLVRLDTASHTNTQFANNIFYQTNGGSMVEYNFAGGVSFRNNNWYGGNAGQAISATDFIGDPRLANPGSNNPDDYKLTASSPILRGGVDLSTLVSADYFGTPRVTGMFDVGAHQFTGLTMRDIKAPTAPRNLRPAGGASGHLDLAWDAATDDVAVTSYSISRNGQNLATVSGTSWSDNSVVEGTVYNYLVVALDAAGNRSGNSNVLHIAWSSAPAEAADMVAPTAPVGLRSDAVTPESVSLVWTVATDNVAVAGYDIYRNNVKVATVTTGRRWVDNTVKASTGYRYQIFARDAAGNQSAGSNALDVQTTSATKRRVARR